MSDYVPRPPLASRAMTFLVPVVGGLIGVHAGVQYMAYVVGFDAVLGAPAFDVSGILPGTLIAAGCIVGAAASLIKKRTRRFAPAVLAAAAVAYDLGLGPVYSLLHYVDWMRIFLQEPSLRPVGENAMVVTTGASIGGMIALLLLTRTSFRLRKSASHGSATWGSSAPLDHTTGLILGKDDTGLLRFNDEGHLMTIAPTRSGKGVGPIISNLLAYDGSVIVTDPKGENYWVTATQRRRMGHRVIAIDPFAVVGGDGAYNPLDIIDTRSERAIDYARMLAEMIIVTRGRDDSANAAFFDGEARSLLAGFMLYVSDAYEPGRRHLGTVRSLLTLPQDRFEDLLFDMMAHEGCAGIVARTAARILQKAERERSGVISTAQSHTHFLDSPSVVRRLRRSSFQVGDLKKEKISLYINIPMDQLDAYSGFLRLMIGACWMGMVREPVRPETNVLFLLDEFANLGRMEEISRAITLLAGYGATIWMFVQNIQHLERVYGRGWKALMDVAVLQSFGTNDQETAEYISKMTGESTVYASSQGETRSRGKGGRNRQRTVNMTEKQRRLMTPDEVRLLDPAKQLIFVKSHAPMKVARVRYFDEPGLAMRADPNPIHEGTVERVRAKAARHAGQAGSAGGAAPEDGRAQAKRGGVEHEGVENAGAAVQEADQVAAPPELTGATRTEEEGDEVDAYGLPFRLLAETYDGRGSADAHPSRLRTEAGAVEAPGEADGKSQDEDEASGPT